MPTLPVPSSSYQLLMFVIVVVHRHRHQLPVLKGGVDGDEPRDDVQEGHDNQDRRDDIARDVALHSDRRRKQKVEGAGDRQNAAARVAVALAERVHVQGPGRSHEAAEDYHAHLGREPLQVRWEREEHVQEEAHRVGRDGTLHVPKVLMPKVVAPSDVASSRPITKTAYTYSSRTRELPTNTNARRGGSERTRQGIEPRKASS
jgi:hypothetical protein